MIHRSTIIKYSTLKNTYSRVFSNSKNHVDSYMKQFWKWTSQDRPSWKNDFKEAAIIFTVFGISGSTSLLFVRPILKYTIGLEGPFMESPLQYILSTILITSPIYSIIVFSIGTLAGRHIFFANMATKVISRFLPNQVKQKIICPVAINSKK